MVMNVKDCIKGNVTFLYYRAGNLWYVTENSFCFPVPIEDVGDATFNKEEKGIMLMRWIRKHLAIIEQDA